MSPTRLLTVACAWLLLGAAGLRAESFHDRVRPLIDGHCIDCHGPDDPEAGLRLDSLPPDFTDLETENRWSKVFDRITAGEMPPASEERPPADLLASAAEALRSSLHAASLRRHGELGRVPIRRLNAIEFENTLHDLLGVNVPLRDILPEDGHVAGFDNVAAGLDLSAMHFLRFQEAAALAIAATIPPHPPIPFTDRRTGREMTGKGPNFRQGLGRSCKLDGDALIFYTKLPRYGLCVTAPVPTAGRYRIRLQAAAVGAEGKAVPVGLMTVMNTGPEAPVLREVRDIPHGEPRLHEFECDLVSNQAFVVNLLTLWDIRRTKQPIEEYTGPGLRVEWMEIEGPLDPFPPPRYDNLFAGVALEPRSVVRARMAGQRVPTINERRPLNQWLSDPLVPVSESPREDAERLIRRFLPRAFRRPVTPDEERRFIDIALAKLDAGHPFADAMQHAYLAILTSPGFLFLGGAAAGKLDDHALASRLSYFLWSSCPDEELLAIAGRGGLGRPATLRAQVERMLADPKAQRFTRNFTGQWLDLRRIDFTIPDPALHPDFDDLLLWSMPRETEAFFDEVLRANLSLLQFVDSDWSMLNARLATLYGVPGIDGSHLRRTPLPPDSHRGGVMTHASVLKVTADGTRTSPVLRGAWVLDRILGQPPAPPPPNIPPIEPDIRGATTIRQQLQRHRDTPACATCHNHIDPPGFALECFDPIGNYRDFYRVSARTPAGQVQLPYGSGHPAIFRGPDVERGGRTADGRPFTDTAEYKRLLLEHKDQIARALTRKLIVYATGADIQFADREVVDGIVATLRARDYGFRTLLHEIVQSRVFLAK